MPSHLLTVITFLPLLGVPALLFLRSNDHAWIRRIALTISVVEFVLSLGLLLKFDAVNAQYQYEEYYDWIGRANIHYHLGVDGISLFLVLLTTFLTPLAILCSWEAIRENVKGFFIALLVIETAMIGVFVSLDLLLFFFFWELTLIPMYFLIGIWGHDRRIYSIHHVRFHPDAGRDPVALQPGGDFRCARYSGEAANGACSAAVAHGTSAFRGFLSRVRH
jgi:NADH-quinone oxidoreductase subunit M